MKYGAVIVAAGMSSRMKKFKPLMEIQGVSMVQRIIDTFHKEKIQEIVVVTGFKGEELEANLSGYEVVCIRNPNYDRTQMFDSAKMGLEYIQNKCDAVFFTPVDIPLFTQETVRKIALEEDELVRIPVCNGMEGHPVCINSRMIPLIFSYTGKWGLRGALKMAGDAMKLIPVCDIGSVIDADTQEDFRNLEQLQEQRSVRECSI